MSSRNWATAALIAIAAGAAAASASANVIAFDDAFRNNCTTYGNPFDASWQQIPDVNVRISDSPAPRYAGDKAIMCDFSAGWDQRGVSLSGIALPADASAVQFDLYLPSDTGIACTLVQLGAPNWTTLYFNNGANPSSWTLDGVAGDAGATLAMTPNTWHTIRVDLTTISGVTVVPGSTSLSNVVLASEAPAAGTTGHFYMDNVQLVSVPEPAALALVGLGSLALLRRRRISG